MFWIFFLMLQKELNSISDNDLYWLKWLIYLLMIDKHIITIEFGSNSFNTTYGFNIKTIIQKEKYLWIEMFEMNDIMVIKAQGNQQIEQPFVGH
jgi:hypothetical protein